MYQRYALQYVRERAGYFLMVVLVYTAGIVSGALAVPALTATQRSDLASYLSMFIKGVTRDSSLASLDIMRMSILNHLKTAALIWVLGITVVGIPLVVLMIFTRGFVTGFTVGFLSAEMGAKGILLAAVSIVPHSLISVPVLLLLAVLSVAFAVTLLRQSLAHRKVAFIQDLASYTSAAALGCIFLFLAALVEAYITPAFMRVLSGFLN